MVGCGGFRALGASLAALVLLAIGVSSVSAASNCSVTVSPHSGVAGTVFSFHGKGFKPTSLTLHKGDEQAGAHELAQKTDPWTVTVRSRAGDEGQWSAEFSSDTCSATAQFTVTLENTDVLVDTAVSADPAHQPAGLPWVLVATVLAAGVGGGVVLGAGVRVLTADNRRL